MKNIGKDELYRNITEFLRSRGIELKDGAYAEHIRRGCGFLTEAINATQRTVKRAREGVDQKLAQLRRSIHEATSPSPPEAPAPTPTPTPSSAPPPPASKPSPARKPAKATNQSGVKPPTARRRRTSASPGK